MPAMNKTADGRLSSWKEIADFLGVDERTCQRWEQRFGLPIQRMGGAAKSRVFADKSDLERWRRTVSVGGKDPLASETAAPAAPLADSAPSPRKPALSSRKPARLPVFLIAAVAAILLAAYILSRYVFFDRRPADFHIDGSALVVTNAEGRALWRHDTGYGDLLAEAYYRLRFQERRADAKEYGMMELPMLMMRDIDRDGNLEVFFAPRRTDNPTKGEFLCFDSRGRLRWRRDTGKAVQSGGKPFPSVSTFIGFDLKDLDGDGFDEVVTVSCSWNDYPTRLLILDRDGTIKGEYWNGGNIRQIEYADLNGDGRPEMVLGGLYNEFDQPYLLVLDPADVRGCSPQGPDYAFDGLGPGSQKFYILLPKPRINGAPMPGGSIEAIRILPDRHIQAVLVFSNTLFSFDFDLKPISVALSSRFKEEYFAAFERGVTSVPLDAAKIERGLTSGILYYDGKTRIWKNGWARSN